MARRLTTTIAHEPTCRVARIYRDTEWGEWQVEFFTAGARHVGAMYPTDCPEDAHSTAQAWVWSTDGLLPGEVARAFA